MEILSFRTVEEGERQRHTQGIELELGYYQEDVRDTLAEAADPARIMGTEAADLSAEIMYHVGGYPGALQFKFTNIPASMPNDWTPCNAQWPQSRPTCHLDLGAKDSDRLLGTKGQTMIIARRLRYRLGVDHKSLDKDGFWWTTPQTEEWIARLQGRGNLSLDMGSRREFNYVSSALLRALEYPMSGDPLLNSPDDWGDVVLSTDPIKVVTIGPYSPGAETPSDVAKTLARAAGQIDVVNSPLHVGEQRMLLETYTQELECIADRAGETVPARERDVLLVYRGGGISLSPSKRSRGMIDDDSRTKFADAVERLAAQGTEVVLGIGHGETQIWPNGRVLPVGVFEAVTPTAAASWVLREHVNNQLVDALIDRGQYTET